VHGGQLQLSVPTWVNAFEELPVPTWVAAFDDLPVPTLLARALLTCRRERRTTRDGSMATDEPRSLLSCRGVSTKRRTPPTIPTKTWTSGPAGLPRRCALSPVARSARR